MIRGFLDSWALFQHTWLAGWCIAATLALLGVLIVARDQIFIGAAVAQASVLGIALPMAAAGALGVAWLEHDAFLGASAVAFAMGATLLAARPPGQPARESPEALTGWAFLGAGALAVLVLAQNPHGTEEIHRLVASSLIGATGVDVVLLAGLLAVTTTVFALAWRPLLLATIDPLTAAALGVRTRAWSVGAAAWLGLAVGLSGRVSGLVFTFGCLVLPALVAKGLCREMRPMLWVSPLVALVVTTVAFVLAHHYDLPPAQMAVALLAGTVVAAWGWRVVMGGRR